MQRYISGLKVALIFTFLVSLISYGSSRYTVLPDKQIGARSTPYKLFIVDTWNTSIELGELVVFKAERASPIIPEGQYVVKFVQGMPGELVLIKDGNVSIQGRQISPIPLQQAEYFEKELKEFDAEYLIPDNSFFAMGTHARSYDSRYWGPVNFDQVVGVAYPVF